MSYAQLEVAAAPSTSIDSNTTSSLSSSDTNSLDVATKRNFSCGICFESYTRNARYPISLICGHTFCVLCIRELSKCKPYIMCGICRKHTISNYKRLGKNFMLMDLLEQCGLLEEDLKDLPADLTTHSAVAHNDSDLTDDFGDTHGSTLGVSNAEMEDLYNTVENINDYLYGYMRSGQTPVATTTRVQEFDELRTELEGIETSLSRERRNFREVYNRARVMLTELRRTSSSDDADTLVAAGSPPVPPALRRAADTLSRAGGFRHAFNDEVDWIDDYFPSISISLPEVDNDDRLNENFIRRENNNYNCYLCNVRFFITPSSISQHVNGRRHRDLVAANDSANASNWEVELADYLIDDASGPFQPGPFSESARSRRSLPAFRTRVELVDLPRGSPRDTDPSWSRISGNNNAIDYATFRQRNRNGIFGRGGAVVGGSGRGNHNSTTRATTTDNTRRNNGNNRNDDFNTVAHHSPGFLWPEDNNRQRNNRNSVHIPVDTDW